jgi:hypothetical protein
MDNVVREGIVQRGLTYAEYLASWRESLTESLAGLEKDARKRVFYSRYNIERHDRAREVYTPSDRLRAAGEAITDPQIWMLLSEDWCGDSAFALPVIAAAADSASVELRILRRDEYPEVMDAYLTNGTRSIPKLVAFDLSGEELFSWGPRPAALIRQREVWAKQGLSKAEQSAAGVEWYEAGNLGEIEAELAGLMLESAGVSIS